MSDRLLAEEGEIEFHSWKVVWFAPDGDKAKTFTGDNAEARARKFAEKEWVADWNPLLEHVMVTTITVSELLPL